MRLRVVIPAHDEERVVGALVTDLRGQDYPSHRLLGVGVGRPVRGRHGRGGSRGGGPRVVTRTLGPDGKGELLKWYLSHHLLSGDEALVVLDADNRVDRDFLTRLAEGLEQSDGVVQASVLPSNLDASPIAAAAGLGDWMAREMIYKKMAKRGWPMELGGTGFAATAAVLSEAGGWSGSFYRGPRSDGEIVVGGPSGQILTRGQGLG